MCYIRYTSAYSGSNIVVEKVSVLLHIREVPGLKPAVQTKFLQGFAWSLQADAEIVSQIRPLLLACSFQLIVY
jgi:hypothetical protein